MKSVNEVHKIKSTLSLWPFHSLRKDFRQPRPCCAHRSSSEVQELFSCDAASTYSRSPLLPHAVDITNNHTVSNASDSKFSPSPFHCDSLDWGFIQKTSHQPEFSRQWMEQADNTVTHRWCTKGHTSLFPLTAQVAIHFQHPVHFAGTSCTVASCSTAPLTSALVAQGTATDISE